MANGLAVLTGSTFDELGRWSSNYIKYFKGNDLTVLFPVPVGPITLGDGVILSHSLILLARVKPYLEISAVIISRVIFDAATRQLTI